MTIAQEHEITQLKRQLQELKDQQVIAPAMAKLGENICLLFVQEIIGILDRKMEVWSKSTLTKQSVRIRATEYTSARLLPYLEFSGRDYLSLVAEHIVRQAIIAKFGYKWYEELDEETRREPPTLTDLRTGRFQPKDRRKG